MTLSTHIRELDATATPLPWEARNADDLRGPDGYMLLGGGGYDGDAPYVREDEDAALIVALRNNVPRILAALELAEACERLEQEQGTTIMQLEGPCMDGTRWRGSRSCLRPPGTRTLSALILALAGRT